MWNIGRKKKFANRLHQPRANIDPLPRISLAIAADKLTTEDPRALKFISRACGYRRRKKFQWHVLSQSSPLSTNQHLQSAKCASSATSIRFKNSSVECLGYARARAVRFAFFKVPYPPRPHPSYRKVKSWKIFSFWKGINIVFFESVPGFLFRFRETRLPRLRRMSK